ncbi:MAG: GNAT family N-acetyltransferase, partial [Chloroflexia bacterium]|nr:GNAT family N-acetyltransferase [Chloroflexia bacterium]
WIYHFFIDHHYQGRGYGTTALQAIIALLRHEHPYCQSVSLTVHPDNVAAQSLYTRAGFVPTGESQDGEPLYRLQL